MDFNNVARIWDTEYRKKRGEIVSGEIRKFIKYGSKGLEIGCGTGLVGLDLVRDFDELLLVDNSKEMIEVVNEKALALEIKNIKTKVCDINDLVLQEDIDFIFSSLVLHHIGDIKSLILKLKTMLSKKGKLCFVDFVNDNGEFHVDEKGFEGHDGFSKDYLKNILEECEFRNIKIYDFYRGEKNTSIGKVKYTLFIIIGDNNV